MMGWSPRCYIPSFVKIGPPVLEKKILKVFTIFGRGGHLGHVTWTIYTIVGFPFPKETPHKIWLDWSSGFGGEDI